MSDTPKIIQKARECERESSHATDVYRNVRSDLRMRKDIPPYALAKIATLLLLDSINVMGSREEVQAGIVAGIVETHRHLQGEGITALLTALGEFGKLPPGQYTDPRNEIAHAMCGELRYALRDRIFWRDPA